MKKLNLQKPMLIGLLTFGLSLSMTAYSKEELKENTVKSSYELSEKETFVFHHIDLGYRHLSGWGVEQNFKKALLSFDKVIESLPLEHDGLNFFIEKAAVEGKASSQVSLASMYIHGQGVEQDYTIALALLKESAETGNTIAINNIGDMYENGYGVPVDYAKAKEYYMQAVVQEESAGYLSMGQLYKLGRGVKKDLTTAKDWYQQACDKGLEQGCEAVKQIKSIQ